MDASTRVAGLSASGVSRLRLPAASPDGAKGTTSRLKEMSSGKAGSRSIVRGPAPKRAPVRFRAFRSFGLSL